ncbi:hypothetical protein K9N68_38995 (plasmid) [Kovacikia minuta CCNUW1]|uniref:hypothetical protein n=1 Tax=Kovacikia minuta TaxID=2931930 RepID=UPI001CCE2844|nr:hypothetical protein [Kovacikia minuta]UBF30133.1 hypothetical protein K9N68_38995 [Kovacikia minuta CCNUW1]
MNTHSLTKNNGLLKFLEWLPAHFLGTSTPLQDNALNQGTSFSIPHTQALRHLQQTYTLERRCFF